MGSQAKRLAAAALMAGLSTTASAAITTLDFELLGNCTGGGGATFTTASSCSVRSDSPDDPIDSSLGLYGDPLTTVRADFSSVVDYVSVALGDWNGDSDNVFLAVYDAANNLLGSVDFLRSASSYEMNTLSLSAANIAYALFGSNAADAGFIAADDFSFGTRVAAVPVPAALLLFGSGLGGLGLLARRRKRLVA